MSDLKDLVDAAKSLKDVHTFLTEYMKSRALNPVVLPVESATEKLTLQDLIRLDKYDEFVAEMEVAGDTCTFQELSNLCVLSIEASRPDFYKLVSRRAVRCRGRVKEEAMNDHAKEEDLAARRAWEAASFKVEHFNVAFKHKCDVSFVETLFTEAQDLFNDGKTLYIMLSNVARYAAYHNRVDVLKILYKRYGWDCSTKSCESLWEASRAGHIDAVKWILETFCPISATRGFHYCPLYVFITAAKLSDTKLLEWLMDRCSHLPFVDYFVDRESPFFNPILRMKVQALNATIIRDNILYHTTGNECRQILDKFIETYDKSISDLPAM